MKTRRVARGVPAFESGRPNGLFEGSKALK